MKFETTILNNNGSWYIRIPPAFAAHMGLKEANDPELEYPLPAMIQDETGKHGKYCSIWKK